jgi:hypothetical protein
MRIAPIDIDFAGWTEVEAGHHNAWGIIDSDGGLRGWANTQIGAQRKLAAQAGEAGTAETTKIGSAEGEHAARRVRP